MKKIFLLLFLLLFSNIAYGQSDNEKRECIKKWSTAFCISTYSHVKYLSTFGVDAAENYYNKCELKKVDLKPIRQYYNNHVNEESICKSGINCAFMQCLNVAESELFLIFLQENY